MNTTSQRGKAWKGRCAGGSVVAQTGSLLYRRLAVGGRWNSPSRVFISKPGRLPTCDTADCQSALLFKREPFVLVPRPRPRNSTRTWVSALLALACVFGFLLTPVGLWAATQTLSSATNLAPHDIRPIKPPVAIPTEWTWLRWVLGALALGALGYLLWRYWLRTPPRLKPERQIPPHERARKRLEAALRLIHDPKPFCIEVSDALRIYLEERFNFQAPERTTEEFLLELQASSRLMPRHKEVLEDFLQRCDLVKFARYEPVESELIELQEAALRLVNETEPPPPLPNQPVTAAQPAS